MHPVVDPYQRIDPAQLAAVKPVRYQARDGLGIPGYLTLPRGRMPKNLPLIVMPHGGPFIRDEWTYDPFVQFLANRGYAVLQPQFRGSTGYGKDFVAKGYGEFGKKMQDDLDDGVDWLVKSGAGRPQARVHRRTVLWRLRSPMGRGSQSRTLPLCRELGRRVGSARAGPL